MREFKGLVRRESSDRTVDVKGDDEAALGVAYVLMLL